MASKGGGIIGFVGLDDLSLVIAALLIRSGYKVKAFEFSQLIDYTMKRAMPWSDDDSSSDLDVDVKDVLHLNGVFELYLKNGSLGVSWLTDGQSSSVAKHSRF